MEQRLQKVLAAAGVGSRRHCEALIATGKVAVDGKIITELGTKVDPEKVNITVDGKPVEPAQEKYYILLNKPAGYTSTRSDPHAKHTVIELVKDIDAFLVPVGRLDVDTSGLLILTNDGDFTQLLTHPSHEVDKTYEAVVDGRIESRTMGHLEKGIQLEDGMTSPAKVRLISYSRNTNTSKVEITIHEGRKRQVKRMFAEAGHKVESLRRVKMGNVNLSGVKEGSYRHLTKKEVEELKKQAERT